MFMSVHKGEGGVKIVPNPVHVVCECPLSANEFQHFKKHVGLIGDRIRV